ncbi:DUF805 domain-containing protein [Novosphingobium sp. FGD1]|uniref:DUF805 domain-containing protein n=1 Tax=Novosphingobium silvae TaxID=2692619 RepID=A0A7X4GGT2_9SPHN|nr:DUF805 domain-containing protein [Novosphingobium silvae]MYL97996.1 DUF805 domain-containing protein [Novosphingobium silvae]
MKDYLRHVGQTLARALEFQGRARRREVIDYLVISAAFLMIVNGLAGELAEPHVARWVAFATQYLILVPAAALVVRRLHDIGWSGRWSIVLLPVALRNMALDLLAQIGGWEARRPVEAVLAYADWVLFPPFALLYLLLIVAPGKKGPNRFGPDPRIGDDGAVSDRTAGDV